MTAGGDAAAVDPDALRDTVAAIFRAVDVPPGDAAIAADALVAAELRGVRTHGVSNLAARYVEWIERGFATAAPRWRITREAPSVLNVDGDTGLGVVVAARVMDEVIERAATTGMCMATIHNSRHFGMAAYHAMLAPPRGMIGTALTAVRATMVPTWGREPRLGTNPVCVAVPAGEEPDFVFDAATTTVPANQLRLAMLAGTTVPPGVMVDADGNPTREPTVPAEPFRLTPLGGTHEQGSHKGYGLAATVDILCTVLGQATFGARFAQGMAAHNLAAINVEAFQPLDEFRRAMDAFLRNLRSTPPAAGHDEVLVAGLREHRAAQAHRRHGLTLPASCVAWLEQCADRFGVPLPEPADAGTG